MKEPHENIRYLRHLKGWNQETVAELLNISLNAYASIEQGKTDPKWSRLKQIAQVLEVDLAALLNFDRSVFFIHSSTANYQLVNSSCTTTSNLEPELEKARLVIEQKTQLLEQKDKEIAHLTEIIELLKKLTPTK